MLQPPLCKHAEPNDNVFVLRLFPDAIPDNPSFDPLLPLPGVQKHFEAPVAEASEALSNKEHAFDPLQQEDLQGRSGVRHLHGAILG